MGLHLLVPIKPPHRAKSRLRGSVGSGPAHSSLVTALAWDTVTAALRTGQVHRLVVVTSDPDMTAACAARGIQVVPDSTSTGLNAALEHADETIRAQQGAEIRIGALHADLPALRPLELAQALRAAGRGRAFCPDRHGTGTTLLLAAPGEALNPQFGPRSARAHTDSGATPLEGPWESVRCDVDTEADLRAAVALGLGRHTAAYLADLTLGESL